MNLDLVIPTHNRAALLERCLESVCSAARPRNLNVTVHIIDNNSSDNTKEIVRVFGERTDVAVRYIFVGRPGKSAALNDALGQTSGELIGFIDDDERVHPEWFRIIETEFASSATLDYIGGQCYPDWQSSPPDWMSKKYRGAVGIVLNPKRVAYSAEFPGMLMGGNSVIRRQVLEKVLPYPENLGKIGKKIRSGEDEVIYHRLLALGANGVNVPELIIYHHIPAERLTKRYFRQWVIGRGISTGAQLRERGFKETGLFGIPRYLFGDAFRSIRTIVRSKSAAERFHAQLSILDCLSTLYGRHLY
jgi:glucosyl-dolichyl phosphate glucuronosyltransferase